MKMWKKLKPWAFTGDTKNILTARRNLRRQGDTSHSVNQSMVLWEDIK